MTTEQFRAATTEDVGAISAYLDQYKNKDLFFYSKKTIQRMVCGDDEGRKPYSITLATVDGQIIGIAIVSSKSKTLSLLFVSPEYRKRGVGKRLYNISDPRQILAKRAAIGYFYKINSGATP